MPPASCATTDEAILAARPSNTKASETSALLRWSQRVSDELGHSCIVTSWAARRAFRRVSSMPNESLMPSSRVKMTFSNTCA